MKLYYARGTCSLAVRIVIHELGLQAEYEAVDLKTKKTETGQDYLQINPKGSVPALLLDNNEILTENTVIQQYLADNYNGTNLLPAVKEIKRYRVLEWLNFITTELHKNSSVLFNAKIPEDIKTTFFIPIFKSKLTFTDKKLQGKKFLMGDKISLADGYLFVILSWLKIFKIDLKEWPNLTNFFSNMVQRQAVKTALSEEGLEKIT